jgi:hypothetical protein
MFVIDLMMIIDGIFEDIFNFFIKYFNILIFHIALLF